MGSFSLNSIGPSWSTGSPMTFITRPSVPWRTALAEVLLHFEDDVDGLRHLEAFAGDAQCLVNRGQARFAELHVHSRSRNLDYVSNVFWHRKINSQPSAVSFRPSRTELQPSRCK